MEEELDWIALSDPDVTTDELEAVVMSLRSSDLSGGPVVQAFEEAYARWLSRPHAVAVTSGTLGLCLVLKAWGIGPGDEVITTGYAWHQIAHAIDIVGASTVLADIDYWCGCIDPVKAAEKITPATKAILASNINGHPADWAALRELADQHGIKLIEDSTEAIGSRYQGQLVGSFGDVAIFDFSQPSALCCGQGELVARALDEGFEGVPRIQPNGRPLSSPRLGHRRVGGGNGRVELGRLGGRHSFGGVEGCRGLHVDMQLAIARPHFVEGVTNERHVSRQDALLDVGVGHLQSQTHLVVSDRDGIVECREPDCFRDLCAQHLRGRLPDIIVRHFLHLRFHSHPLFVVHSTIHRVWKCPRREVGKAKVAGFPQAEKMRIRL